MKRRLFAVWMALVMILALTACGGAAKSSDAVSMNTSTSEAQEEMKMESVTMDFAAETEYGGDIVYESPESEAAGTVSGQKLIRTAWLTMETTEFEAAVEGLTARTEDFGGYFETCTVTYR